MRRFNLHFSCLVFGLSISCGAIAAAQDAFTVKVPAPAAGRQITPYLRYQVDQAWEQDERRLARLRSVRTENGLRALQVELRGKLLDMIGGLPAVKTPLNARVTGTIQISGYRLEKVIFESIPGFHVTAHMYVPDSPSGRLPAVLVSCGHSANGKIYYQYICHRLAKAGYVVFCWDPVGQGERSQFWDAEARRSRYNLVCGEHAVLGNLAYLAGTNLARWEIWDGIRALDYLLTRPEVDPGRVSITGTSGGGFQASHIAALDERIRVAAPSCYISALPMRMSNRIFADPDSDPEQDLYRMVADGVDHPGLLLLVYPRPLFLAAAVEDFFPIEGTRKSFREVKAFYREFGHSDRMDMVEGYHRHQYSPGNLKAAFDFMNRHNNIPPLPALPEDDKLDDVLLLCTRSGQVRIDYPDGKSLMDLIRDYYLENRRAPYPNLKSVYGGSGHPAIGNWQVSKFSGAVGRGCVAWELRGSGAHEGYAIDRYLLHHSEYLSIPLLHVRPQGRRTARALLWVSREGKLDAKTWPAVKVQAAEGEEILSFDFRGLGEDRMPYDPASVDGSIPPDFGRAYTNPLMSVLANYVYNSLLVGRPYFLQMIEDAEIVTRFAREKLGLKELVVGAGADDALLARALVECVAGLRPSPRLPEDGLTWSGIVERKLEVWPICYLLPGGAYLR
ncbi:MAG: acetylxylan esterase [Acidobacteria bacterium]|nr:acetylxylan esterase [Acidobacteriota bacterium]